MTALVLLTGDMLNPQWFGSAIGSALAAKAVAFSAS
jgi:hypothetical protein